MSQPPRLSHLQFLVLGALLQGERAGRDLRRELGRFGVKRSGPGFYQLMARLEESEMVEGWYEQKTAAGQLVRERTYKLTAAGRRAWNICRKFNERVIAEFGVASA